MYIFQSLVPFKNCSTHVIRIAKTVQNYAVLTILNVEVVLANKTTAMHAYDSKCSKISNTSLSVF